MTGAAGGIGRAIAARLEDDGLWTCSPSTWSRPATGRASRSPPTWRPARATATRSAPRSSASAGSTCSCPTRASSTSRPSRSSTRTAGTALLAILLTSPFLLAKHAWEALAANGDGRIVVIASAHALVASPFKAGYVSAKHGVLGLVKTLALEGAEQGILATAVCPGYVRTPLVEQQVADQAKAHGLPEERVLDEVILAPQPVKRLIEPEEVAGDGRVPRRARRARVLRRAGDDGPRLVRPLIRPPTSVHAPTQIQAQHD